jgi:hypothetical protein
MALHEFFGKRFTAFQLRTGLGWTDNAYGTKRGIAFEKINDTED